MILFKLSEFHNFTRFFDPIRVKLFKYTETIDKARPSNQLNNASINFAERTWRITAIKFNNFIDKFRLVTAAEYLNYLVRNTAKNS